MTDASVHSVKPLRLVGPRSPPRRSELSARLGTGNRRLGQSAPEDRSGVSAGSGGGHRRVGQSCAPGRSEVSARSVRDLRQARSVRGLRQVGQRSPPGRSGVPARPGRCLCRVSHPSTPAQPCDLGLQVRGFGHHHQRSPPNRTRYALPAHRFTIHSHSRPIARLTRVGQVI